MTHRCEICGLSSHPGQNVNHPSALAAPTEASYQQWLRTVRWHRDKVTGGYVCGSCTDVVHEMNAIFDELEEGEVELLDEDQE
jgi:hypothetical protein